MKNLKPRIQNLMRLGLQAAKLAHDDLAAEMIREEGSGILGDMDAMTRTAGTRQSLIADSDFRKAQAVAHDGDRLISWEPGAGHKLLLAARQIDAGDTVQFWHGEDSPDIQVMF